MDKFKLSGELNGQFVTPSPLKNGDLYHGTFEINADLFGFISVGVEWKINDRSTDWKCFGKFSKLVAGMRVSLFQVNVHLAGSSDWLYEGKHGSILNSSKKFERISIEPSFDFIKDIAQKAKETIKEIGEQCQAMWNAIKNNVKETREEIKKVTDKLCFNPPCLISNLLSTIGSIFSSAGAIFNSIFGRKKKVITFHGYNEFKCTIYKVTIKKCTWRFCSTVGVEYNHDKKCMDQVRVQLLEAKHKEELANWKENVVVININSNKGIQYVINQTAHNLTWFDENDIYIDDIVYDFKVNREDIESKIYYSDRNNFDPNNTTFFDEFDKDITNIFEPFDDTDTEIDLSQVYKNDQELNYTAKVTINTSRLSNLFPGKDNLTVNVSLVANFDFNSEDLLLKTTELLVKQLSDKNSDLINAIFGDNVVISTDLIDAYGMNPPFISLNDPKNPKIYCDDPEIEMFYGDDDNKVIEGLRKHLTPIFVEQIYTKCKSNIENHDIADCFEHETICGATNCRFTRYIFDGCGQKSNEIFEDMVILPRKPYFVKFPDNMPLSCDETKNVTDNISRFVVPEINSGCRNVETDLYYDDTLINENICTEYVYRKWRVEMIGCEKTLFTTRNQKLFVEDKKAPIFIDFPSDKLIDFFDPYGTEHTGVPKVFDSCGHGPSKLNYEDKVHIVNISERIVYRTWLAEDFCGNKRQKTQKITIKNSFKNDLNSNYRNFLLFSFNKTEIFNSLISGSIGSKQTISLINSTIGNDLDFETKCNKEQKWSVLSGSKISMEETIVHGSIKTLSDFDFNLAHSQALELSKYLNNSVKSINIGFEEINCVEKDKNLSEEFPLENYKNSSCSGKKYKQFSINTIDETNLDLDSIKSIKLNGDELVYNVFYFNSPNLIESKEIEISVPETSVVVINFNNLKTTNLNLHKIKFNMNTSIKPSKVIYNFLSEGDILFDDSLGWDSVDGTILAPNSNFIKISKNNSSLSSKRFINGQIFAQNIYIDGVSQPCILFEALIN